MSEDTIRPDDLASMSDLEKRVLTVLSVLEASRRSEESSEYSLPDGRRVKPTIDGIKSFLKDAAAIETDKMQSSMDQLLQKKLIVRRADCHFLSDAGKKIGKKLKTERMSKGYDNLLLRTGASKAYSTFCERVFAKDLSQFNVLDMEQLNTLVEKLDLKPGETALDLGCGNGRVSEYISDLTGAKMVGLDFAAEVIKSAQQRTLDKKSRLTYVVGNMDELSFEEGSFDAVISIDTLYFVESIDATIKELKRLLKPSASRMAIFCDQNCDPDESRDILLPENTKVGKALRNNGLTYQAIDFTSNSKEIWLREIRAAEELREQFVKEGNTDIYEDRAQDAKKTLESIESGRHVRYFYLARLQEDADTRTADVTDGCWTVNKRVLQASRAISRRLAEQGAEAVVLFGSCTRGDAYAESDIDIHAVGKGPSGRLERHQGFLISISWATARQHRQAFKDPSQAGGIVPAWRNAMVIYDPQGIARELQQDARRWRWSSLGKRADRWVAEELTGWAEEVHRLVGNLQLGRRSAAAVQRSVLAIQMARVLAVHHRILYDSENRLWDLVSAKMGREWSKAQSAALGEGGQSFEDTCKAALQLFTLAAQEVKHILDQRQHQVVAHACEVADRFPRKSTVARSK